MTDVASLNETDCRNGIDCQTNSAAQPRPERKNVILKRGRTITKKRTGDVGNVITKRQILSEDSRQTELIGKIERPEPIYRNLSCPNLINENLTEYPINSNDSNAHNRLEYSRYSLSTGSSKNHEYNRVLLKNIKSIQPADQNAYHINVSNSKFFVPRDYIYSNIGRSLDDLRFRVDPEMTKIFRESIDQKSNSTSDIDTCITHENSQIPTLNSFSDSIPSLKTDVSQNTNVIDPREISNDDNQSREDTIPAKPILIDESGMVKDYLISASLDNPNPHLIVEPKIYIPRLSTNNTEREFVYENDQSSNDATHKFASISDNMNQTAEQTQLERPMPSPRKLVRFEDEMKDRRKYDEKIPQQLPSNISIVNIPFEESPKGPSTSDKLDTSFPVRTPSLREKFESIAEKVELRGGRGRLWARMSDRKSQK